MVPAGKFLVIILLMRRGKLEIHSAQKGEDSGLEKPDKKFKKIKGHGNRDGKHHRRRLW